MSFRENRRIRVAVFAGLCLFILNQGLFAQTYDKIVRKDTGKTMTVDNVISETFTEVNYKKGGTEKKISTDKVLDIKYYDVPNSYKNALAFALNGEYENAIASFKLAKEDTNVRSWIKSYSLIEMGKVYQQWGLTDKGKFTDAISTFNEVLTSDPESRFYADILLNLGRSQALAGDLPAATTTFDRLSQEAYDKKLGVIWEAQAKIEKANAQLQGRKFGDAERDYRSAMTFATEQAGSATDEVLKENLLAIAGRAKQGQGSVMIEKKDYRKAAQFFKDLISDTAAERTIKAGAECGLGEVLMAEGKLKDAQIQFARTKVLYGDLPEEGARATYNLGLVCLDLKEKEPSYKKRAKIYFTEVIDWYPNTEWAKKARSKID